MNGFTALPLKPAGLWNRLTGNKRQENALIEINNLLAERPLTDLKAADVERVLSDYRVPREDARPGLEELYRDALGYRAEDHSLSDTDVADMRHLRYVLGLEDSATKTLERDVLRAHYRDQLKHAVSDGQLTAEEKNRLHIMAVNFDLPDDVVQEIYKEEVLGVVQEAFSAALADKRLTSQEEQRLADLSAHLGVTVTHDADTQRRLERFRLLAQIDNGILPQISSPLRLYRGEVCHARFDCSLNEKRTVTKAIHYHGPYGSIRIMKGLSYRYGSRSVQRVTAEEARKLDTGTLYVTSKRLLFNGVNKNVALPLTRVVHFTLYDDGLQIEKDSGRDQYYIGTADWEVIGAILERALSTAR